MPSATLPQRQRRLRIPLRVRLFLVAILAAAIFFGFVEFRSWRADVQLRRTIEEISRYEPGWQLADLEAKRIDLPDYENSAVLLTDLNERYRMNELSPNLISAAQARQINEKLDIVSANMLADEMDKVADLAAFARKLNDLPKGRFSYEWNGADWCLGRALRHVEFPRKAILILRYDSRNLVQRGDLDSAIKYCCGMLNAGSSLAKEHCSIAYLQRKNCDYAAIALLERILANGTPSDQALQSLQKRLESELKEPIFLDWIISDRALFHECVQEANDGKLSQYDDDVILKELRSPSAHEIQLKLLTVAATIARREPATAFVELRAHFSAIALEADIVERREGESSLFKDVKRSTAMFLGWACSNTYNMIEGIAYDRAKLACGNAAIAVERYRLVEKKWPDKPQELVPKYLSEWPNDPFDNKPLRYRRLDSGHLVIYSVGSNNVDDGGQFNRDDLLSKDGDVGIELFPVAERGLPFSDK